MLDGVVGEVDCVLWLGGECGHGIAVVVLLLLLLLLNGSDGAGYGGVVGGGGSGGWGEMVVALAGEEVSYLFVFCQRY